MKSNHIADHGIIAALVICLNPIFVKVSDLGFEDLNSIPAGDCASFLALENGLCVPISTLNTVGLLDFPLLAVSYWITTLNNINNNNMHIYLF